MSRPDMEIGDLIAAGRSQKMPCFCDAKTGTDLLDVRRCGALKIERVGCDCGKRWTRVWTHGTK